MEAVMDESWLSAFKKTPPADWAESLRVQLQQSEMADVRPDISNRWRIRRLVTILAVLVLAVGIVSVPALRASAVSFLSLFRVVNFVAVPVDPGRLRALDDAHLDLERLIGDRVEVLADPGPPKSVASIDEAEAIAGFQLKMPTWLAPDTKIIEMAVSGERAARVTADSKRLEEVLDTLGITDLRMPAGLDGQAVTVRVPPIVMVRFETGGRSPRRTRFFQAPSPEITMPPGVDSSILGEIGLRVLGVPKDTARQFAAAIDWNTTLILPVPPTAQSFRQVEIGGNPGVAIGYQPPNESPTTMLLWSNGGRVFGMQSIQSYEQVVAMADSVR
jgi:hypothetical protein